MTVNKKIKEILKKYLPQVILDKLISFYLFFIDLFGYRDATQREIDYDEYWKKKAGKKMGRLSLFRLRRAEAINQLITTEATVLDIGCGDCAVLSYIKEKKNIKGYGIDISEKAVDFGKKLGFEITLADLKSSDWAEGVASYDYIIASEIIEHIPEPEKLLFNIREKFNKKLIISIPNSGYLNYRLRLLFGKFPMQWLYYPGEHLRFWTLKDFKWWTNLLGYSIEQCVPYEGVSLLRNIFPSLFARAFVFSLKRK